ncbi:MAG: 2-oxoacid:acceptor oxidoreductase family protein, partial [Acidimicrobiales bacterium]
STLFEGSIERSAYRVFDVPATSIAIGLGNEMGACMVMLGAYIGVTGIVQLASAVEGMRQSLPPYRRQHAGANEEALHAGHDATNQLTTGARAWQAQSALSGGTR